MTAIELDVDGIRVRIETDSEAMAFGDFMEFLAIPALSAAWSENLVNEYMKGE